MYGVLHSEPYASYTPLELNVFKLGSVQPTSTMLVLPTLHTYLSQLLSPPSIHTALLLTPEGALVSYASQMSAESSSAATFTRGSQCSPSSSVSGAGETPSSPSSVKSIGSSSPSTPQGSKAGSVASTETRTGPALQRTKDEIRMAAGLGAEVWAETREEGEGMVESEVSSAGSYGYSTTTTRTARADSRARGRGWEGGGCGTAAVAGGERDAGGRLGYDAYQGMSCVQCVVESSD